MAAAAGAVPIHVVKGDDPVLLNDVVRDLVTELVGDGDRSLMVEEVTAVDYGAATTEDEDGDEPDVAPVVMGAQTPPFLTERRVVVARHAALFSTADLVAPLVGYLDDPLDTTSLVLVWEKGPRQKSPSKIPKKLADAVKAAGGVVVDASAPKRDKDGWIKDHIKASSVSLDATAQRALAAHLGEDVQRLGAIIEVLESTYGPGAKLGADDVEPFLGEEGGATPWGLTDAIDDGDIPRAIDQLHRMMGAGNRHALQIVFTLHRHYESMMRMDDPEVRSEADAAAALGMKSLPFPMVKALKQGRLLGSERIADAVRLIAKADVDLKGATALDDTTVMELLVSRLAQRSRQVRRSAPAGRR